MKTRLWLEAQLNIVFFTGRDDNFGQRIDRNEELLQILDLVVAVERNLDCLLGKVDQRYGFGYVMANALDSKIDMLVLRLL